MLVGDDERDMEWMEGREVREGRLAEELLPLLVSHRC